MFADSTNSFLIDRTDWNDGASVARTVKAILDNPEYKREAERRAYINIEFAAGNQWLRWNERTQRMERDLDRPREALLRTADQIGPSLEHLSSEMNRAVSVWNATPGTDDDADRVTARLCADVLKGYYQELGMEELLDDAFDAARVMGTVFLCYGWNPKKGVPITVRPADLMPFQPAGMLGGDGVAAATTQGPGFGGQPMGGPMMANPPMGAGGEFAADSGTPDPALQAGMDRFAELFGEDAANAGEAVQYSGDVEVDWAPLFEIGFWPFNVTRWADVLIWTRTRWRPRSQIKARYGLSDADLDAALGGKPGPSGSVAGTTASGDYRDALADAWYGGRPGPSGGGVSDEQIPVTEVFLDKRADERWPRGRAAVVIGNRCVQGPIDIPYKGLDYCEDHAVPILPLREKPRPGKLWGTSSVDAGRSMQQEKNQTLSDEANYRFALASTTLVRIQGDLADDRTWSNKPGFIPEVRDKTYVPEWVQRPSLGNDYKVAYERATLGVSEAMGVTSTELGRPGDSGTKSGIAIRQAREIAQRRRMRFGREAARVVGKLGGRLLGILAQKHVDDKIVQYIGENNRVELRKFNAELLRPSNYGRPGASGVVIVVDTYDQLPDSPSELFATLEALTGGQPVLQPAVNPADRKLVTRMAQLGSLGEVWDEQRPHEARADDEHDQWRQGRSVGLPGKYDDHETHYRLHSRWIGGEDYQEVVRQFPKLAQEIAEHLFITDELRLENQLRLAYNARAMDFRLHKEFVSRELQRAQQARLAGRHDIAEQIEAEAALMFPAPLNTAGQMLGPPGGDEGLRDSGNEGLRGRQQTPPQRGGAAGRASTPQSLSPSIPASAPQPAVAL